MYQNSIDIICFTVLLFVNKLGEMGIRKLICMCCFYLICGLISLILQTSSTPKSQQLKKKPNDVNCNLIMRKVDVSSLYLYIDTSVCLQCLYNRNIHVHFHLYMY